MQIETGIPLPSDTETRKQRPFTSMNVGDSVLVTDPGDQLRAMQAARKVASRNKWKFTGRHVEGGYRIWRVS